VNVSTPLIILGLGLGKPEDDDLCSSGFRAMTGGVR